VEREPVLVGLPARAVDAKNLSGGLTTRQAFERAGMLRS